MGWLSLMGAQCGGSCALDAVTTVAAELAASASAPAVRAACGASETAELSTEAVMLAVAAPAVTAVLAAETAIGTPTRTMAGVA